MLPDIAKPLEPTAMQSANIASSLLRAYATTRRNIASPPKPEQMK